MRCSTHAGAIEQLLQDTIREFNITVLSNARAIEQVVSNLEVVGVRLQKHVRQEYQQALEDWRLLHTKHVIAAFVEKVNSTDMAQPLRSSALVEEMKKWQQDTAVKMGECLLHGVLALQSLESPERCQECDHYGSCTVPRLFVSCPRCLEPHLLSILP